MNSATTLPTLCNRAPSGRAVECRPASACRFLLTLRRSDSSAFPALSCTSHSFAARVYRLVRPHSFTHYALVAGRPYCLSLRTVTSKLAFDNNHHRGRCLRIVRCLFLATFRHLHSFPQRKALLLRTKRARPPPDAIAHSSPACAANYQTLVILDAHLRHSLNIWLF